MVCAGCRGISLPGLDFLAVSEVLPVGDGSILGSRPLLLHVAGTCVLGVCSSSSSEARHHCENIEILLAPGVSQNVDC